MRAAFFVALFGSCSATSCMLESPTEPSIADCQPLCDASACSCSSWYPPGCFTRYDHNPKQCLYNTDSVGGHIHTSLTWAICQRS